MTVSAIQIEHYRSIRSLDLPLGRVTVLLGANGCGKTNCYRAMRLLHAAASGRLAETLLEEGGMPSALWAGDRKREEVRLRVGVEFDRFSYALACGLPTPSTYSYPPIASAFGLDPEVKEEDLVVQVHGTAKPVSVCERRVRVVTVRDEEGRRTTLTDPLDLAESVLTQLVDPSRYAELALVRAYLQDWRFYHHFRVDALSPLREERLAVRAPVLASDGLNLAAALQTITEIGHGREIDAAIEEAFPGSRLEITRDPTGRLGLSLRQPGSHRAFAARELSDGTLRFLCLVAALLTPRPPIFLAFNEPESSLHPDMLPALAGLISRAAKHSNILVTTHASDLADRLAADGALVHHLEKIKGATQIIGTPGLRRRR